MQIESILIFIALIVISSFANKRKEAQHKQRQQQKREAQPQQAQPQMAKAKQQKPGKRTLQDLFREMQQEMETEYKKVTDLSGDRKKQAAPSTQKKGEPVAASTYKSTDPRVDVPSAHTLKDKKPIKPSVAKKKSPVYENEIKDRSVEIGFDMSEEAILNGIIFSEVIGKPKAKR